jgi:CDP-paratose 2-epimerase
MGGERYTLITGGAGFIGSNLAEELLAEGRRVVLADSLVRPGVVRNAEWLQRRHGNRVRIERADVRDAAAMVRLVAGAEAVYHLAAQVAVTTSFADPVADFEVNLRGTLNVLEAARRLDAPPPVVFTSTNKVYGGLRDVRVEERGDRYVLADAPAGIGEDRPLDFHSPYGCSKGAADQYVRDYARAYGVPTVVFRMSCVYGRRQWGTEEQGWVAHFGRALLHREPITIYGDGRQVRDLLWVDDVVVALRRAVQQIGRTASGIYNIGGGPTNAVSVREVVALLAAKLDREPRIVLADWRAGDQRVYVTDTRRAREELAWQPTVTVAEGVDRLVGWLREAEGIVPMWPASAVPAGSKPDPRAARAAAGAGS